MTPKTKIIHLQLLPLMSGVQKVSFDELVNLDPALYERIIVCKCSGELTESLEKIGVRVHLVPELQRSISPKIDLRAYFALREFFRSEKPDIVHTHSSKTGVLGRLAAHFARVPFIVHTVHGFSFPSESRKLVRLFYKFLERICGRLTDVLIVLNENDAAIASDVLGVSDNRIMLLPNGVDIDTYVPAIPAVRESVRLSCFGINSSGHLVIAMIGRLWEQKNPQCFVRAALQVIDKRSDVSFFMIGDGEFRGELEATIQASSDPNRIRIMGWRSDVPMLLKGVDLMVLPSRWEGMPLAILEAMASGVPVIASDIPGNHHLVTTDRDGLLFAPDDSEALADALLVLIDDHEKRRVFSLKARKKVVSEYALSVRMNKIRKIYQSCLLHFDK
ncbi:MAG: glycosyltransferase family 4 protein [Fluviibacter phosphoraccumulans]